MCFKLPDAIELILRLFYSMSRCKSFKAIIMPRNEESYLQTGGRSQNDQVSGISINTVIILIIKGKSRAILFLNFFNHITLCRHRRDECVYAISV
jgi:hypothetical protein